ncbi:alpha/beta hydrolase [Candidatus Falkowbacteria bacterium]|nr:alpha/beta hydrolase [Candidatus Falkowbacteria bacterium]
MKEYYLESRGIYYRTSEFEPGRKTLVFVHGLSGSSSAWLKYESLFENEYNVITFDLRGHGQSAKPKNYEDYAMSLFADDLEGLVKHLGLEGFVLISHSFGTLIALEYLSKNQESVDRIVFLSPDFAVKKRLVSQLIRPLLLATSLFRLMPFKPAAGKHIDYERYPGSGDWNIPRMIADVGNTTMRVYLYCTRQTYVPDWGDFLPKIIKPTLIIHGRKDSIFPVRNSLVMDQKIKDTKLVILPEADHILVLNNFAEVSQVIKGFVG